jgi:hypothetical protein
MQQPPPHSDAELAMLASSAGPPMMGPGPECLDEMGVARMAEGSGAPGDIAHTAACGYCRGQVAAAARAIGSAPVAAEIARLEWPAWGRRSRRLAGIGGLAAAAVVAVLFVARQPSDPAADPGGHRDPVAGVPAVQAPVLLSPVEATVHRPVVLDWRRSDGATQYQVAVFDAEGTVMWKDETADSTVTIPAHVRLDGGVTYWWRVEARIGYDRWLASDVNPFTLAR